MADEKKVSSLPSGYRKKPLEPKPSLPERRERVQLEGEKEGTGVSIPSLSFGINPGTISLVAIIVALISLILAFSAFSGMNSLKAEAKAISTDLKALRDTPATFSAQATGEAAVSFSVPVREAVSGGFSIPVRGDIPIQGTGQVNVPVYGVVGISFNGTAPVDQSFRVESSQIPLSYKLSVYQEQPLSAALNATITPKDLWGPQLDSIIKRLDAAGG